MSTFFKKALYEGHEFEKQRLVQMGHRERDDRRGFFKGDFQRAVIDIPRQWRIPPFLPAPSSGQTNSCSSTVVLILL
jgi:hypothetical protein